MIETADANAACYYHFDGLGSVIALSDDDGDTVVTYEYDAFGVPASSDPNHPNPFLFTGRRYDPEETRDSGAVKNGTGDLAVGRSSCGHLAR